MEASISVPTQFAIRDWLWTVHKLFIEIRIMLRYNEPRFTFVVYNFETDLRVDSNTSYFTPQEAVKHAIQTALKEI